MMFKKAAYGGEKWSPRIRTHREEIGPIWAKSGINSEWAPLKSVLLHTPGLELDAIRDPERSLMLEPVDHTLAKKQHDDLARTYQDLGIAVHYVDPDQTPSPNLMFCADLVFMTPEGAILARPASTVRAGEEVWIARRLADLGIPILRTLTNQAVFEGADALWIDSKTVLLGIGLRTNAEAVEQIQETLKRIGVEVVPVDLPAGTMHLMGILRFLDKNLTLYWPYRLAWKALRLLEQRAVEGIPIPDEIEASRGGALNFVTIGPKEILLAAGNPVTQEFLEKNGVTCHTVKVGELHKAAGGIGCLTAVLEREMIYP
jgi:N-dimethylarginine dimethylaminohydrolase